MEKETFRGQENSCDSRHVFDCRIAFECGQLSMISSRYRLNCPSKTDVRPISLNRTIFYFTQTRQLKWENIPHYRQLIVEDENEISASFA